jgi:hypothetical protein
MASAARRTRIKNRPPALTDTRASHLRTREEYKAAGGTKPVGTSQNRDVRWLEVVRTLYQEAWTGDRNQLLTAKAKAGKSAGAFH